VMSVRLHRELSALRQLWQNIQRQLKRRVIFGTIDVIRSWNAAQVRTIQTRLVVIRSHGFSFKLLLSN